MSWSIFYSNRIFDILSIWENDVHNPLDIEHERFKSVWCCHNTLSSSGVVPGKVILFLTNDNEEIHVDITRIEELGLLTEKEWIDVLGEVAFNHVIHLGDEAD